MSVSLISERVSMAQNGSNPYVISKLTSGWLVVGDVQPLPGYCVYLADPVVASINDLDENDRSQYSLDVLRCGDAILNATKADRMNYETWGNTEPALHTHLVPRYSWEEPKQRCKPACMGYSWDSAKRFDPLKDNQFVQLVSDYLKN